MPALSPTMEKGNLARWLKKEGDKIKSGDVIAEIETDKATMEYEAVDEGTLAKIVVPEGTQDVAVNAVIAVLAGEGEDVKAAAAGAKSAPAPKPPDKLKLTTHALAQEGRRQDQVGRHHRRDRDRQGDHGIRGGRRGHARQDRGAGRHAGRGGECGDRGAGGRGRGRESGSSGRCKARCRSKQPPTPPPPPSPKGERDKRAAPQPRAPPPAGGWRGEAAAGEGATRLAGATASSPRRSRAGWRKKPTSISPALQVPARMAG